MEPEQKEMCESLEKAEDLFSLAGSDLEAGKKPKKETNIEVLAKRFVENPTKETFHPLFYRMRFGLQKLAFKYLKDTALAEEMVLITFEKIWKKHYQFDPKIAKFSTWSYNILRYACLAYLNEKRAQNYVDNDINDLYQSTVFNEGNNCENPKDNFEVGEDGTLNPLSREEIIMKVYDVSIKEIGKLPDNIKLVMTEKLVKQKKLDEVAEEQNIPISSVKNWLRVGRLTLRDKFQNEYKDLYEMYLDTIGDTGMFG